MSYVLPQLALMQIMAELMIKVQPHGWEFWEDVQARD